MRLVKNRSNTGLHKILTFEQQWQAKFFGRSVHQAVTKVQPRFVSALP